MSAIYFDAPGSWTSPSTVVGNGCRYRSATGGSTGGAGGASSFFGITLAASPAGANNIKGGSSFNSIINIPATSDGLLTDIGKGSPSGAGTSHSRKQSVSLIASTVYPITIGQAGAGGGGNVPYYSSAPSTGSNGVAAYAILYY